MADNRVVVYKGPGEVAVVLGLARVELHRRLEEAFGRSRLLQAQQRDQEALAKARKVGLLAG